MTLTIRCIFLVCACGDGDMPVWALIKQGTVLIELKGQYPCLSFIKFLLFLPHITAVVYSSLGCCYQNRPITIFRYYGTLF